MKYLRIASAVALIPALCPTPALAAPLAPAGQWQVAAGDAQCMALRRYGPAAKPAFLLFKPAPLGDVMQILVVRQGSKPRVSQAGGTMRVDGGPATKISILDYGSPQGKDRVSSINVPLSNFAAVRTASTLSLNASGSLDYSFALSEMASVMQRLDACTQNLRKAWHIGEASSDILQEAQSKASLPSYFGSNDYPAGALASDATGLVEMVSLIDEAGKVASCMVIATSGYAILDAQSCAVMTDRASFRPALGLDGKPIRSGRLLRIRWQTSR